MGAFGSPEYNPPELNDPRLNYGYDPLSADVFSLGCQLFLQVFFIRKIFVVLQFEVISKSKSSKLHKFSNVKTHNQVMKSMPFKRACRSDPYYKRLISPNTSCFWKISEPFRQPSENFRNQCEQMLQENPQKRITIAEIKKHPWFIGIFKIV